MTYQLVFDALPQPATLIDAAGIIVDINAAFLDMGRSLGIEFGKEDRVGYPVDRFASTIEHQQEMSEFVHDLLRSGAPQGRRWDFVTASGAVQHRKIEAYPLKDATGQATGALLLWDDLTEQLWQQRQQRCRERLREAFWQLRHEADTPRLLTTLFRELQELFPQIAYCSVQLFQAENRRWQAYAADADQARNAEYLQAPGAAVEVCWREQQPVYRPDLVQEDVYQEAGFLWDEWNCHGVRSVLDVPFPQGTLAVNSHQPQAFDTEEIAALGELAHVLSAGLARLAEVRSQARYRALVETPADMMVMYMAPDGRYLYVSPQSSIMTGYPPEAYYEDSAMGSRICHPDDVDAARQAFLRVAAGGPQEQHEIRFRHRDGTVRWRLQTLSSVRDTTGQVEAVQVIFQEITQRKQAEIERKQLQNQLLQAQKMESVGRLAGGVAHDFNNMLSVILGYTQMALKQVDPDDALHAYLNEILNAGQRSADITRHLLAFARQQPIAPRRLDLNETVEGMLKVLRRLIGEDLDLAWLPGARLWPVNMDPGQLDQLLANLCVNARDAIDGVGKVTIETGNTTFDSAYCAEHAGFIPGDFVMLAVSDNGCGMDKETLEHVFEPFFTTKEVGQGTGLGLSTVYGIVKQNRGFVNVYSEPGKGTTVRIYMPRHEGNTAVAQATENAADLPLSRGETVLLVEDERAMLQMSGQMLEQLGYRVLKAVTPEDALRIAAEHSGQIELLFTDVVMPHMNGRELVQRLKDSHPDLTVLFMSGYTANAIVHHGVLDEGMHFIQKPFDLEQLAVKVRQVLDPGERA